MGEDEFLTDQEYDLLMFYHKKQAEEKEYLLKLGFIEDEEAGGGFKLIIPDTGLVVWFDEEGWSLCNEYEQQFSCLDISNYDEIEGFLKFFPSLNQLT